MSPKKFRIRLNHKIRDTTSARSILYRLHYWVSCGDTNVAVVRTFCSERLRRSERTGDDGVSPAYAYVTG
jgi:hypothetical protein